MDIAPRARRALVAAAALAALLAAAPGAALAQAYPSKPVRLVVGFAPGGPADVIARIIAPRLAAHLGQPVVVENRPGADANIALESVAKAPADGYTIHLALAAIAINPAMYPNSRYDPIKDFAPITLVGHMPNLLTVHPSVRANTLAEFIQLAKGGNARMFYGTASSNVTLATEMLNRMAGIQTERVNYKGGAPAIMALMAGDVQFLISGIGTLLPHVKSGKVRALAISSGQRSPQAPEVPTVQEAGVPGYAATTWYGVIAPGGTPRPVIDRLNADLRRVMAEPDVKTRLQEFILEPTPTTPEQFGGFIAEEVVKWARVVKETGLAP